VDLTTIKAYNASLQASSDAGACGVLHADFAAVKLGTMVELVYRGRQALNLQHKGVMPSKFLMRSF
jgi:hypothetical protein